MAKMNKFILKHLISRVERLDRKLCFLEDFLPITVKEKESNLEKRLNLLKKINNEKIKPYTIKAGVKEEYIVEEKKALLEKIEKKYDLKFKALKQSKKRKMEKAADTTEIEKVFKEKEKHIFEAKEREIRGINGFYEKDKDYESVKERYDELKTELDLQYQEKERNLKEKHTENIEKFVKKISNKKRIIENRLVGLKLKIKTARSEINDLNYGLDKDTLLKLENLTMKFGGLTAVNDLSFEVKKGEIFGLIGPNGAGKTTIFNCITRFYRLTSGKMYFRENEFEVAKLNDYKVHDIVKLGISRTFQNVELIWELSILDNLLVAAHTKYQTGFLGQLIHSKGLKREETVYKQKAQKILELMDLLPYQHALPIGLPYGILKKIELARTLMINPKMIILDEPAAGLNEQETKSLADTIRKIRSEYDATIFLVEHDMGLVMDVCDIVCAISFGKKLAIGSPKEIQANKKVREAYLGEEQ